MFEAVVVDDECRPLSEREAAELTEMEVLDWNE